MSREDGPSLARRAWLRAVLWGAGGLSLLPAPLLGCKQRKEVPPTCYAPPPPPDPKSGTFGINGKPLNTEGTLGSWRELGRLWRELSAHARGKYEIEKGEEKLKALEAETTNALAVLPASRELRTLFEERVAHVRRSRYVLATCYAMAPYSPAMPRGRVEEQMTALRKLQEDGKLTREAAEKAARVVAVQAEFMTQLRDVAEAVDDEGRAKRGALYARYRDDNLEVGQGAQDTGRRVVEFEVDKPGLLLGSEGE